VELKDKILSIAAGIPTASPAASSIDKEVIAEAVSALSMLGFPASAANKVVQSIAKEQSDATVEQLIKLALKQL
jgi:Holliday junction DNA helicase RuvA